jgi:hypothetical protein
VLGAGAVLAGGLLVGAASVVLLAGVATLCQRAYRTDVPGAVASPPSQISTRTLNRRCSHSATGRSAIGIR